MVRSRCKFLSYQLTFWKYDHFHESENLRQQILNLNQVLNGAKKKVFNSIQQNICIPLFLQ